MKIIDQTPFFKENGELSLMDRGRAIMQFGSGWIKETDAQKTIIAVLDRVLDQKYTLLRNVTPPGLGTMIPLILIGSAGIYVMGINPTAGLFSARGDQWGVISGGSLKPTKPNLLARVERMARAIQVYLQRQGYSYIIGVEAILLCSDPYTNVDSVRPIIRVVMRDALERFAVSIAQARVVLSPEAVFEITNRLLNPPVQPKVEPVAQDADVTDASASRLPDSVIPRLEQIIPPEPITSAEPVPPPEPISNYEISSPPPAWLTEPSVAPSQVPSEAPIEAPPVEPPVEPPARQRMAMSRKQWGFLIGLFAIWAVLVIALILIIVKDLLPLSLVH